MGVATAGVGVVACGALAGAVGNAVSYAITAAQTGQFSRSGLGKTALAGAAIGGLTGGLQQRMPVPGRTGTFPVGPRPA